MVHTTDLNIVASFAVNPYPITGKKIQVETAKNRILNAWYVLASSASHFFKNGGRKRGASRDEILRDGEIDPDGLRSASIEKGIADRV